MNKRPTIKGSKRRNFRFPHGTYHASQCVAGVLADIYFRLDRGTPRQRQAAKEFASSVIEEFGGKPAESQLGLGL